MKLIWEKDKRFDGEWSRHAQACSEWLSYDTYDTMTYGADGTNVSLMRWDGWPGSVRPKKSAELIINKCICWIRTVSFHSNARFLLLN